MTIAACASATLSMASPGSGGSMPNGMWQAKPEAQNLEVDKTS